MKLVKINDVRKGQIYKDFHSYYLISSNMVFDNVNGCRYPCSEFVIDLDNEYIGTITKIHESIIEKLDFVGFLDITHKVIGNKLIEIPREELEKDDIIEARNIKYFVKEITNDYMVLLNCDDDLMLVSYERKYLGTYLINYKKIGTLMVNYEFINDKLNENEKKL